MPARKPPRKPPTSGAAKAHGFGQARVAGCNRKRHPFFKPDARDRTSWLYRECDVYVQPACDEHSTKLSGQIICDRCRR